MKGKHIYGKSIGFKHVSLPLFLAAAMLMTACSQHQYYISAGAEDIDKPMFTAAPRKINASVEAVNAEHTGSAGYKSSNEKVAVVDENGQLIIVGSGKAVIYVTNPQGITSEYAVNIPDKVHKNEAIADKQNTTQNIAAAVNTGCSTQNAAAATPAPPESVPLQPVESEPNISLPESAPEAAPPEAAPPENTPQNTPEETPPEQAVPQPPQPVKHRPFGEDCTFVFSHISELPTCQTYGTVVLSCSQNCGLFTVNNRGIEPSGCDFTGSTGPDEPNYCRWCGQSNDEGWQKPETFDPDVPNGLRGNAW